MESKKARDKPGTFGERLAGIARRWGADLLLCAGAAMIAVGAALIYVPAGWITGGILMVCGGILAARGSSGGDGG